MIENFLRDWWFLIMAVAGFGAGYVKLQARVSQAEKADKDHSDALTAETTSRKAELIALETRIEKQRKEDMVNAKEARDATNTTLAEIRADVKALLRQRP
jgi:hypothetical protein